MHLVDEPDRASSAPVHFAIRPPELCMNPRFATVHEDLRADNRGGRIGKRVAAVEPKTVRHARDAPSANVPEKYPLSSLSISSMRSPQNDLHRFPKRRPHPEMYASHPVLGSAPTGKRLVTRLPSNVVIFTLLQKGYEVVFFEIVSRDTRPKSYGPRLKGERVVGGGRRSGSLVHPYVAHQ